MIYLTAQRVVSPDGKRQGINSFRYQRNPPSMPLSSLLGNLEVSPGTMVAQRVLVQPPGNGVRSYLDIVVPDHVTSDRLAQWIEHFIASVSPDQPMPWSHESGEHAVRFLCNRSLSLIWEQEIRALSDAASVLLAMR